MSGSGYKWMSGYNLGYIYIYIYIYVCGYINKSDLMHLFGYTGCRSLLRHVSFK